jgi:hypothetical protein
MKVAWVQALLNNYDDSELYLKQALELQINAARAKRAYATPNMPGNYALDADLLFDDFTSEEEAEVPNTAEA